MSLDPFLWMSVTGSKSIPVMKSYVVEDIRRIMSMAASAALSNPTAYMLFQQGISPLQNILNRRDGIIVTDKVPTAAISEDHLWINPEFWASLNMSDKAFVIEHETNHITQGLDWAKNWGWDPLLTNLALDLFINHILLRKPYGRGPNKVSTELAENIINYRTVKRMISEVCDDVEVMKDLVSDLRNILREGGPISVPLCYSFFSKLTRKCGREKVLKYVEENFVLYNDITHQKITEVQSKSSKKQEMKRVKSIWELRNVLRSLAWDYGGDEEARRLFDLVTDLDLPRKLREQIADQVVEYLRKKGYVLDESVIEHIRRRAI